MNVKSTTTSKLVTNKNLGSIVALNDIFITAPVINVNGLIQSGVESWSTSITAGRKKDTTSIKNNGTGTLGYRYDKASDTYVMDTLRQQGGNVYLTGAVVNSNAGEGKIIFYTNPSLSITNHTNSNLDLGGISLTSLTDNVGKVYIREYGGEFGAAVSGNTYTPTGDYYYMYQVGTSYETRTVKTLTVKDAIISWFDWEKVTYDTSVTTIAANVPMNGAGVIINGYDSLPELLKNQTLKTTAFDKQLNYYMAKETLDLDQSTNTRKTVESVQKGLFITYSTTYKYVTTVREGKQDITYYAIKMNNPISIETKVGKGDLDVKKWLVTGGNVSITDAITVAGDVTIDWRGGSIVNTGSNVITSTGGGTVTLDAKKNIGSASKPIIVSSSGAIKATPDMINLKSLATTSNTFTVTGKEVQLQTTGGIAINSTSGRAHV